MTDWTALYTCKPPERDRAAAEAFRLWLGYYVVCERHDRTVCSAVDGLGNGRPATPWESQVVTAFARQKAEETRAAVTRLGVSNATGFAARRDASRIHFEDAVPLLARLNEEKRRAA